MLVNTHKLLTMDNFVDDKEKHLSQLRERLTELEVIIDTNSSLMENHRLHVKMKEMQQEIV